MQDWLPGVATVIAILFGGGGLIALFKIRPEAGQAAVVAAEGAMRVQDKAITRLEGDVARLEGKLGEVTAKLETCEQASADAERLRAEVERLTAANKSLARRQRDLEDKMARHNGEPTAKRDRRRKPREED